ncbi:MAG: SAM-dependent methyltransferase [Rhabdochlamydiaceae bacterium]|nr:SAM-dependent methyltransferase [Rhabdochlamydiaceae bacterium]
MRRTTGYLSPPDLQQQLKRELKNIICEYDRLIIAEGPPQTAHWAQNIWFDPQVISFTSISEAAKKLKEMQKLWSFYPYKNIRRGTLISEKLPYFSAKPIIFPSSIPKAPLGSWTLLDPNTLLASPLCSSSFAQGEVHFQESKVPPSRAYLKLWEALTRIGVIPKPDDVCLEVGASPGSWTWVLQQLGSKVIAVDRALLDPSVSSLPNVTCLKKDAFSLKPMDFPKLDWIFSDLICYPEKLLAWLNQWLEINAKINFVCTLKFQGEGDRDIIKEFEKIAGSHIVHLFHNKHELTWFKIAQE